MPLFDRRSLFEEMERMQRQMNRLSGQVAGPSRVYPPINIYDAADGYHLRVELPGIDPDTLDVTVTRNEVVLKGERKAPELAEGARYHRRERDFGKFSRAFAMPDNIDPERVEATYRDGVLDVVLARQPETGPRKVAISTD